uniref:VWFA domain-containing protein n=1 Tax=Catagonus wagneri TaxID=51154 RepID=A0A8C3YQQ3_9CETA
MLVKARGTGRFYLQVIGHPGWWWPYNFPGVSRRGLSSPVCREASVGDVVFLVDTSISPQNTRSVRGFLSAVVSGFNISKEGIRVGLAQYSSEPRSEFLLSTYHQKGEVLRHIQRFPFTPGGHKTGLALQFLLDHHFQETAGSRASLGVPQIAMVISASQAEDQVREPAEAFRSAGIQLYAVGVGDAVPGELREIASRPEEKFVSFVPSFSGLGSVAPKLRQELCDTLAKVASRFTKRYSCREAVLADIVFLVDSSTSIGPQNFQKVKNFLHSVVLGLDISSDQVRVGLAQYNDDIYPAFRLNQYPLKSVVLEQIRNLPYRTGGTNTGSALEFIRTSYLTEAAGSRAKDGVPQIVILVTDGESNDEVQEAADKLKEDGAVVYVVGVNVQDVQELQTIASEPLEKFLFNTENFNILQDFSGSILQTLCSAVEGKIKESAQHYADVVFLADTSQNTSWTSFQWMQKFISRVIGMLDVDRDKYQIGLAQYGGQGHTEFLLDTYQTQDAMMAHICEHFVPRGGSRRTGKALRYLHQTFFQEAAGSRFLQGVPQYAVVITAGKSEDEVRDAAQTLREKGVKVVSVGVQDFDKRELEGMGTPPLVYEIQGQDSIRQVMQDVSEVIQGTGQLKTKNEAEKDALEMACPTAIPADLVFLIEEFSRARQSNFQLVVNFLKTTIGSLGIPPGVVRIGLVFYSEEPRLEFALDAFRDPAQIVDHLDDLAYRGGAGGTKTGTALDFLREEVFIQEKGGRSEQGVRQVAVVITEGFSQDNVSRPASLLRRAGVTIYAVGTQLALESTDLEKIASYPPWKHVIPLESYLQLAAVGSKIKKQLCPEIVRTRASVSGTGHPLQEGCVHIEKADIYFLIDGSGSIQHNDFLEMKVFMNEVIKMFHIGPDRVQFGVVQYSDEINSQFPLNQHPSVARLKVAIDGIQQKGGGTMTGQALGNMVKIFADTARSNVPWYLIIITDGQSMDPVAEAAEALRGDGVTIYAVGVRDANTVELREIAEDRMFFVHDFDSLKAIQQEVVQDICSSETCKNRKADIIFLMDGSESISAKDFEKMKDFMKRMVNQSNIGADEIQIGLLQFSSTPQEEFRLNQYSSKVDIHRAISNVKQIKDGTYTGRALHFTLPFFGSARGGRPSVHQYLIVITDGVAQDNVAIPAQALRDRNIIIFAVGVGEAKNSQLLEITNDQSKVYYEEKFDSLQNLEKEILYRVCIPQGCNVDLSVGIDLSGPTRQVQQSLQGLLPELMQELAVLSNISCGVPGQTNVLLRYLVPGLKGQVIFDSGFEKYNDEAIQKFLIHQVASSNHMDVDFLHSLGENAIRLSSAKVKVLLVFTDGLDDDLERMKEASMLLRNKGFSGLLTVGLEGVHKLEELQELEFGRGFAYTHPLSITQQSLPSILLKQLDTIVERTCCNIYAKCFGEDGHRGDGGGPGMKVRAHTRKMYHFGVLLFKKTYTFCTYCSCLSCPFELSNLLFSQGDPGIDGFIQGPKGEKGRRGHRVRWTLFTWGYWCLWEQMPFGVGDLDIQTGNPGPPGPKGSKGKDGPRGMKVNVRQHSSLTVAWILLNISAVSPYTIISSMSGVSRCPLFPTEVVFALDVSNDVSQLDFERMRGILLSLLMKMEISGSTCPTGARVAIVSYSSKTDYLVRFSDHKGRTALLQAVRGLALARSSGTRNLGDAMRFVARHVFKRGRSGHLLRKVAVFFQVGWTQDAGSISTAMLELSALDVIPIVITFTEGHNLPDALLMDGTSRFHLYVWETEGQLDVEHVARCTLCYDQCRPAPECGWDAVGPLAVDVDLAFVVDSSHGVDASLYRAALTLVDAVLDDLEVAVQPSTTPHGARVALVTYTTSGFWPGAGQPPAHEGFHLTSYSHRTQMQRRVRQAAGYPLQGAPALGHALEWTLERVLLAAQLPRRAQVLFAIVASETSVWDQEKLRTLSLEAKCKGIILFVLALGPGLGTRELEELARVASAPSEQHLLRLEGLSDQEMAYARRFTVAFLNLLKSGTNQYPPPELTAECGGPSRGDTLLLRRQQNRFGRSGLAGDLEAPKATDPFLEENGKLTRTSITQHSKGSLENDEKSSYDAEENEQEKPPKPKETGKEKFRHCLW